MPSFIDRRTFLTGSLAALSACSSDPVPGPPAASPNVPPAEAPSALPSSSAPAVVPSEAKRPKVPFGVQSGDVTDTTAVVWSKADRPAVLTVEWSESPDFASVKRVQGPLATAESAFTARVDLADLPPGRRVYYRVSFAPDGDPAAASEPVMGSLMTAPRDKRDVLVAWSGDTAGQGWGINLAWGGMKIYETIRNMQPDLFIHCGDQIYADSPIVAEVPMPDGTVWRNLVTPEKSKVAETLDEFRGNFTYNLLDANVRRMNAEVASVVLWDDHEIHNNWYPGQTLDDDRYTEKRTDVLKVRARQAMFEHTPIRHKAPEMQVYRTISRGPSLDVFVLDERSYRGPNSDNLQTTLGPESAFLGPAQLTWLKGALLASKATWKLIASDMPLSLVVPDGRHRGVIHQEAWANVPGPPLGRELELAALLAFIKRSKIKNVLFVTADVHYAAAHRYHPRGATFKDFDPFWEFVAGPLHASTYGPNPLDPTFGPEVVYKSPPSGARLRSPAHGGQYFGTLAIDGKTERLTASLWDLYGKKLYSVVLDPAR